jgi:transposase, IS30 family
LNTYIQFTQAQKYQIKALLSIGTKKAAIARELAVDKSTILRELKRNRGKRGYRLE